MTGSYRASIGHNPLIRVKKQSLALAGQDIGGTIGAGTGPRVGVYWRLTGERLNPSTNISRSAWSAQAPFSGSVDGARPTHMGSTECTDAGTPPAAVLALTHFEIVSGTSGGVSPLESGAKFFRGTLYPLNYTPAVNYGQLDIQNPDKPRIDIINVAARDALHAADPKWFHYRTNQRLSFGVFLAANYLEETSSWRETFLQIPGAGGAGSNNLDLSIQGSGGGANWTIERTLNGVTQGALGASTPVTNAHKGAWVIHTFFFNIDNRASGGSPKFEWVMNISGQPGSIIHTDNSSPWGFDETSAPASGFWFQLDQVYKGGWHGATQGAYNGVKTTPLVTCTSSYRLGDSTSGYSDVHPTRDAHP